MFVFGYLLNDNHKMQIKVKEQDLIIVKLEDKVTTQQTEMNLLAEDNKTKQDAILALEEKARISSLAAQEAVERLIELANIERGVLPAGGPNAIISEDPTKDPHHSRLTDNARQSTQEDVKKTNASKENDSGPSESAAGKEKQKTVEVVNEPSSKKFIELRNNIYSRYK